MNISSISAGIFSGKEGYVRQCIIIPQPPEEEEPEEEDPEEHSHFKGQGIVQGGMLWD